MSNLLLGPLQDNGGPTLTHALLPGSPALDAGLGGPATDQSGAPRPVDDPAIPNASPGDGSDIGAFESGRPRLAIHKVASAAVLSWLSYYGGLRCAIGDKPESVQRLDECARHAGGERHSVPVHEQPCCRQKILPAHRELNCVFGMVKS